MTTNDLTVTIQDDSDSGETGTIRGTVKAVKGPKGPRGESGQGAFRQFAVIGVFVILVALTLAYLVQQGRDYTAEQCQLRRDAVIHNNQTWDQLTAIEEIPIGTTSAASAKRIAMRTKVYADAKVPVPSCDQR